MVSKLIFAVLFACLALAGRAQTAAWEPLKLRQLSLSYPPTWHLTKETRGAQTRITITPDSMQHLEMRMVEIMELPTDGVHNYAYFKKNFTSLLQPYIGPDGKFLKNEETTFKGRTSMYAEFVASSLPTKVYGVDDGAFIYIIIVTQRRYSQVADPGIERDETGILNSVAFAR